MPKRSKMLLEAPFTPSLLWGPCGPFVGSIMRCAESMPSLRRQHSLAVRCQALGLLGTFWPHEGLWGTEENALAPERPILGYREASPALPEAFPPLPEARCAALGGRRACGGRVPGGSQKVLGPCPTPTPTHTHPRLLSRAAGGQETALRALPQRSVDPWGAPAGPHAPCGGAPVGPRAP